jgi:hypothetical protein
MDSFIAFAEVVGAIIAAMGLAMWLEWLTLNGLLHLMPGQGAPHPSASKQDESRAASRVTSKGALRDFSALTLFPH